MDLSPADRAAGVHGTTAAPFPAFGADLLDPAQARAPPLLGPASGPGPHDAAAVAATRWVDGAAGGDHSIGSAPAAACRADAPGLPHPLHAGPSRAAPPRGVAPARAGAELAKPTVAEPEPP